MNKTELIAYIAENASLSKADASRAVDSFIEAVSVTLKEGESVTLIGFGTFTTTAREARMGRNPRTGEAMEIAASILPRFKAGKALRDAVN